MLTHLCFFICKQLGFRLGSDLLLFPCVEADTYSYIYEGPHWTKIKSLVSSESRL